MEVSRLQTAVVKHALQAAALSATSDVLVHGAGVHDVDRRELLLQVDAEVEQELEIGGLVVKDKYHRARPLRAIRLVGWYANNFFESTADLLRGQYRSRSVTRVSCGWN
jgi:hypothetical protein